MDNVVTLTNTKEQTLDFDVTVNGVDSVDMQCKFVIETSHGEMGFAAHRTDPTSKWEVKIPALPHLERTGHNFRVDVIVDGYYFEAMRGLVNVVGPVDLYSTEPRNVTLGTTRPEPRVEPVVPHNTVSPTPVIHKPVVPLVVEPLDSVKKDDDKEDSIAAIARKLIQGHKDSKQEVEAEKKAETVVKKAEKKEEKKKDKKEKIDEMHPRTARMLKSMGEKDPEAYEAEQKKKAAERKAAKKVAAKKVVEDTKPVAKKKVAKKRVFKKVDSKKESLVEKITPKPASATAKTDKDIAVTAVLEGLHKDDNPKPITNSVLRKGKVVEG